MAAPKKTQEEKQYILLYGDELVTHELLLQDQLSFEVEDWVDMYGDEDLYKLVAYEVVDKNPIRFKVEKKVEFA